VLLEGLGKLNKFSHPIVSRTRDLPSCSIVPTITYYSCGFSQLEDVLRNVGLVSIVVFAHTEQLLTGHGELSILVSLAFPYHRDVPKGKLPLCVLAMPLCCERRVSWFFREPYWQRLLLTLANEHCSGPG
jgi:hypothetical protein